VRSCCLDLTVCLFVKCQSSRLSKVLSLGKPESLGATSVRMFRQGRESVETSNRSLKSCKGFHVFQCFKTSCRQVLKPAPQPYEFAAREMGLSGPSELRMVAAHCWDCAGAMRAGAKAAFVNRPSAVWDLLVERTDIVGLDLMDVAKSIIERRKGGS
jgi:beta-phosphoglucomutase-like phosphatase (HAD superfamily)